MPPKPFLTSFSPHPNLPRCEGDLNMGENLAIILEAGFWFFMFGLFHSLTAHEWFKAKLARVTSEFFVVHFWRLPYCIISFWMLYYLFLPQVYAIGAYEMIFDYPLWLWNVVALLRIAGLIIIYWAFIQFDYLEFWGFKQMWQGIKHLVNKTQWEPIKTAGVDRLEVKGIYHFCRHPMLTGGFLLVLTLPPTKMTFVYSFYFFVYMLVGWYFEEKRLVANIGPQYLEYRKQVGAFLPNWRQITGLFKKSKPVGVS